MLLYLGHGRITDKQLPHRTTIANMIMRDFIRECDEIEREIQVFYII
jgi:hypothetical protein